MKTKIFFQAFFLCLTMISHAQVKSDVSNTGTPIADSADGEVKIFTRVEQEAEFPGGIGAWGDYLRNSLDPEVPIRKRARRGTYQVIIRFIVNKEGAISNVTAETSFGHGMEEEAIRVIKNGPRWTPAYQNGRPVNAYRRQPITFVVQ